MKLTFNRKGTVFTGDPNNDIYNQSYVGNAEKVLFTRNTPIITDIDPGNIIARGQNFSYQETYQIIPVMEWNTYYVQELLLGMQEIGSFDAQVMFSLRTNDSLPNVKTLPWETEIIIYEMCGDEHPQGAIGAAGNTNAMGMVLNVWYGCRFTGHGGSLSPNAIRMINIRGLYRYRLTGKDWKLTNPSAIYPGNVKEVSMGASMSVNISTVS